MTRGGLSVRGLSMGDTGMIDGSMIWVSSLPGGDDMMVVLDCRETE
jgi:hypothetical protein